MIKESISIPFQLVIYKIMATSVPVHNYQEIDIEQEVPLSEGELFQMFVRPHSPKGSIVIKCDHYA